MIAFVALYNVIHVDQMDMEAKFFDVTLSERCVSYKLGPQSVW
jgi:hypothetical protein